MRPELVMKSIVPVVMAGVLGTYGLIIDVIISTDINPKANGYYLFDGYAHVSSDLACCLAGLSTGIAIGIVGELMSGMHHLSQASLDIFRRVQQIENRMHELESENTRLLLNEERLLCENRQQRDAINEMRLLVDSMKKRILQMESCKDGRDEESRISVGRTGSNDV